MKRKHQLLSDTFKAKKRQLALGSESSEQGFASHPRSFFSSDWISTVPRWLHIRLHYSGDPGDTDKPPEGPAAVETALQNLASLFPRKVFEDSLPPLILKHQIYSLVKDRTVVDRYLSQLKNEGRIRMFQHSFEADFFVVAFMDSYISKVQQFITGKDFARTVRKFLDSVLTTCPDISFDKKKMLRDFGFSDTEITQLVNAGVLTVRDAGSWWLAVPGAGRFIKCFIKGRKAVLGMIQKSKYKEVLLSDLQSRQAPSAVKLGLPYHIHDIIGAQLVDCVPTTSGTLLRLADD